jgi:hypothetical protein
MRERDDDEPLPELSSELASLWRAMPSPDPTAVVDRPDAATRATVAWLRTAYVASGPASSALPWRIRVRSLRRRSIPWLAPWIAAAALLLAIALLLPSNRRAASVARGDLIVAPPVAGLPTSAPTVATPVSAMPVFSTQIPDAIPLVAFDARRMEMRRGPVRLILVTNSKPAERSSAKEPK